MGNLAEQIMDATKTSLIDKNFESAEKLRPKLLYNDTHKGNTVLANIDSELKNCDSFWFSVAFITKSGLIVLKETLKELSKRNIKGKILTTNYLEFNEPGALRELLQFENLEVRVFTEEHFHTKGYMFKNQESYTFVVGSSNLTQFALKSNKEWNLKITSLEQGELMKETNEEFGNMWNRAISLTENWIKEYEIIYKGKKKVRDREKIKRIRTYALIPNAMQIEATRALAKLREENKNKALLISATGTGKTYLSAFDVRNMKPKKLLFLVHRERILKQAEESFKDVLGEEIKTGFLSGNTKEINADYLFSTTYMMSKESMLNQFGKDYFDYIIIDETHRAGAEGYRRILDYFKPKFLLGMTATPERTDGYNIYQLFDHNIAYEIRLQQAMEEDLLCPFHYFGISELSVNGQVIDEATEFRHLVSDIRVDNIIEKIIFYGYSGNRAKGLIFCNKIEEAKELSKKFNERGYNTVALSGEDKDNVRSEAMDKLEQEDREGGLDYIFTINIMNEGVDLPSVNQIIMLRPTESSIIFVQQLGRGLRKYQDKDYVVVIDFIGNYQKNFLIPIALSGDRTYNKDTIRKYVAQGNRVIPGCSTVNFDLVSKQRIYAAIDVANFSDVKLLKEEYQKLKDMLGRIPDLEDFEKFGTIDIMRIFDNKTLGSYHNFLKKYDKDYKIKLNSIQEEMLAFISQKIVNGKRIHELQLLKRLLHYKHGVIKILAEDLENQYGRSLVASTKNNLVSVLTNQFVTNEAGKKKFSHSVFLEKEGEDYQVAKEFNREIHNQEFNKLLNELLDFGIRRNQSIYQNCYKNTDLVLFQKYTYEDVCKLLNWEQNVVAQNIGGYKYDELTNTFPVFVNYNKDENINNEIKYEDRFLSPSIFIALSKKSKNKSADSVDVKRIYNMQENGMKIYLFVRKNKDDDMSKEFYFLGTVTAIGKPKIVVIKNTDKRAVEITYQLETPVREDIYEYLTK